jgi:hypothetical protein
MKTEYKRENRMNVGLSIYPVVMLQVVDEMKWAVMYMYWIHDTSIG